MNWKTLTMKFVKQGQVLEVKGDLGLSRALVSQTLLKMIEIKVVSMLWMIEKESVREKGLVLE